MTGDAVSIAVLAVAIFLALMAYAAVSGSMSRAMRVVHVALAAALVLVPVIWSPHAPLVYALIAITVAVLAWERLGPATARRSAAP